MSADIPPKYDLQKPRCSNCQRYWADRGCDTCNWSICIFCTYTSLVYWQSNQNPIKMKRCMKCHSNNKVPDLRSAYEKPHRSFE